MGSLFNKSVNKVRSYVLDGSMTWFRITVVLDQEFKKSLWFGYFNELNSGSFGNGQLNKSIHYVLDILIVLLWDSYITNQWIKSDTMC